MTGEVSIQSVGAKETEINNSIFSHLLRMGLIRKVTTTDESSFGFELTAAGMQFIADYEWKKETNEWPRNASPDLAPNKATPSQPAIALLNSLKLETMFEQALMARVSIVIPALNEAENITILLKNLARIIPSTAQIIVVDGGSTDATVQAATARGATVIPQERTGKGDALSQAFESNYRGDIVVTMDADGSNRPESIPRLVAAIINGADIAKGSRFLKGGGSTDLSLIRKIGNKLFVFVVNNVWSGEYTDLCYGFMAFKREALNRLNCLNWTGKCRNANCYGCHQLLPRLESKHFQIETEICVKARKLGLKVVEVPSVELKRNHGASKLRGFRDSLSIAKTILHELFSGLKTTDNA